jgi:hypothetical protein
MILNQGVIEMENFEELMSSLEGKTNISQEAMDALTAKREAVKQHYRQIRDALREHKEKMGGESMALALSGADGAIVKTGNSNLPVSDSGHGTGEVLKAHGSGGWCDMLEAAHDLALNSGANTGSLTLLSSMYYSRGGKDLFEKLKDSRSRKQVMDAIIARQIVECETISQLCTTMLNEVGPEKIQSGFDNDGTFFQNVLKTKLRVDAAQRAAMQAESKLSGVQLPGLNVKNVGQLNLSGVQQVRNEAVVEEGENNIVNSRKNTLTKHKRPGDLECTYSE